MTPGPEGPEDGPRRGGPALEAMYGLTLWLIPTLERFPRRQKSCSGTASNRPRWRAWRA